MDWKGLFIFKQTDEERGSPPPQSRPGLVRPHHGFFHSSYQSSLLRFERNIKGERERERSTGGERCDQKVTLKEAGLTLAEHVVEEGSVEDFWGPSALPPPFTECPTTLRLELVGRVPAYRSGVTTSASSATTVAGENRKPLSSIFRTQHPASWCRKKVQPQLCHIGLQAENNLLAFSGNSQYANDKAIFFCL